jgi:hypothetical protein
MFEVTTQAAIPPQPPKRPLHDPAARQHGKPLGVRGAAHDLEGPPNLFAHVGTDTVVSPVSPNQFAAAPAILAAPFEAGKELRQDPLPSGSLRNPGAMPAYGQPQPQHVPHDMPLAPVGRLVPSHAAVFAPSEVLRL